MKAAADPTAGIAARPMKIGSRHLERLAVVYIRQSSLQQVQHNQESTRLQYSLEAMARELGWEPGRILVLDEDLGTSGASVAGRQDAGGEVGEEGVLLAVLTEADALPQAGGHERADPRR
jgi:hypothetical protein